MTPLQELAAKFVAVAFSGPPRNPDEIDAYNIGFKMGSCDMGSLAKFISPENIKEAYVEGYEDGVSASL